MEPDAALVPAAESIRERVLPDGASPALGVVLGSGWDGLADALRPTAGVDYADLRGFAPTTVPGHRGRVDAVVSSAGPVLVFRGRFHVYEGHGPREAARPVDLLATLGCRTLFLTCATGSLRADLGPGDLVLVTDHLNLMGVDPAEGAAATAFFPDRSMVYDPGIRAQVRALAARCGFELHEGVLGALRGPGFETPAEVRALRALGADVVGMSGVPEALRASDLGMRVVALAAVANRAAGLGRSPLTHDEVLAGVAAAVASRREFLANLVETLAAG
jgi:xanthosine phosphorylase